MMVCKVFCHTVANLNGDGYVIPSSLEMVFDKPSPLATFYEKLSPFKFATVYENRCL